MQATHPSILCCFYLNFIEKLELVTIMIRMREIKIGINTLIIILLLSGVVKSVAADEDFDVPGSVKASDTLPANFLSNEHFTIREEVTGFDGLNLFTVDTEYGSFEIWGEPMLRVRLQEFVAWKTLLKTSSLSSGAQAIGRTAFRPVDGLLMAFAHPITTIEGVPLGISRMFKDIGRDLVAVAEFVSGQESEDSAGSLNRETDDQTGKVTDSVEALVGVNGAYRRWAQKAGVNPYTSNPALKDELNRLAKPDAYLSASTWLLGPDIVGRLGIVSKVSRSVYEKPWEEIVEDNRKLLSEMGVGDQQIKMFFDHDFINLSLMTLMVESLNELEGVEGRPLVINQAILLDTEAEAIWFAECLLMAQWFHVNEASIAKMLPDTLVPVALTKDHRVIAFSAADYAYWTEEAAIIIAGFTSQYSKYSDRREAWIADQASPRFIEGMRKSGWTVRSGLRSTVLPEIPWGLQDEGS